MSSSFETGSTSAMSSRFRFSDLSSSLARVALESSNTDCDTYMVHQSATDCFSAAALNMAERVTRFQSIYGEEEEGTEFEHAWGSMVTNKKTCSIPENVLAVYRHTVAIFLNLIKSETPGVMQFDCVSDVKDKAMGFEQSLLEKVTRIYLTPPADATNLLDGGVLAPLLSALLWCGKVPTKWIVVKVESIPVKVTESRQNLYDALTDTNQCLHNCTLQPSTCILISWNCVIPYYDNYNPIHSQNLLNLLDEVRDKLEDIYAEYVAVAAGVGIKTGLLKKEAGKLVIEKDLGRHSIAVSPCVEHGKNSEWRICDSGFVNNPLDKCVPISDDLRFKFADHMKALINMESLDFVLVRRRDA